MKIYRDETTKRQRMKIARKAANSLRTTLLLVIDAHLDGRDQGTRLSGAINHKHAKIRDTVALINTMFMGNGFPKPFASARR
jgi:hypothetical protein